VPVAGIDARPRDRGENSGAKTEQEQYLAPVGTLPRAHRKKEREQHREQRSKRHLEEQGDDEVVGPAVQRELPHEVARVTHPGDVGGDTKATNEAAKRQAPPGQAADEGRNLRRAGSHGFGEPIRPRATNRRRQAETIRGPDRNRDDQRQYQHGRALRAQEGERVADRLEYPATQRERGDDREPEGKKWQRRELGRRSRREHQPKKGRTL
jgi:hypothetical protein